MAELLLSLHDSPLATAQVKRLVIQVLSASTNVPAYAKDLIHKGGMFPSHTGCELLNTAEKKPVAVRPKEFKKGNLFTMFCWVEHGSLCLKWQLGI